MSTVASSMPATWWEIPTAPPTERTNIGELRDRLIQQLYFLNIRTYIHLPFFDKSVARHDNSSARMACMEACRQLLRRYLLLRSKVEGEYMYDCKLVDFIGFTATIILLIGHSFSADSYIKYDRRLVSSVEQILLQQEREDECHMARQFRQVLQMLSESPTNAGPAFYTAGVEDQQIRVPYFGIVMRKVVKEDRKKFLDTPYHDNGRTVQAASLLFTDANTITEDQFAPSGNGVWEYAGFTSSDWMSEDSSWPFGFGDDMREGSPFSNNEPGTLDISFG